MTQLGPGPVIPAAPLVARVHGLLEDLGVVEPEDNAWINGLNFQPEPCFDGTGAVIGVEGAVKTPQARPGNRAYTPFLALFVDQCSTFGLPAADYEGRARRGLLAYEGWQVEHEFWTGTKVPGNYHLNDGTAADLNAGTALAPRRALELLLRKLADTAGGQGMIHATVDVVEAWFALDMLSVDRRGRLVAGATGSIVIPYYGGNGSGPGGAARTATTAWAYVTELIRVLRQPESEIEVMGGANATGLNFSINAATGATTATNSVRTLAERAYGIVWNGCTAGAVNVDLAVGQ